MAAITVRNLPDEVRRRLESRRSATRSSEDFEDLGAERIDPWRG